MKIKIIITVLVLIILLLGGMCAFLLMEKEEETPLAPDIAPSYTDKYSEPMDEDNDNEKLEHPDGGGAASIAFTKTATIDLSKEQASVMFGNPSRSEQDMMVQIVIQDVIIAQSGLITPGNKISTLDLLPDASERLDTGLYLGSYIVLFYNRETGEREVVSTEIPINIFVNR